LRQSDSIFLVFISLKSTIVKARITPVAPFLCNQLFIWIFYFHGLTGSGLTQAWCKEFRQLHDGLNGVFMACPFFYTGTRNTRLSGDGMLEAR